jgi:CheY-like chemotaxis protein
MRTFGGVASEIATDVLIIDDDPDASAEVSAVLAKAGLLSVCAPNGQAALDLLENGCRPSVALVDLRMPTLGGLAFARRLGQVPDSHRPELVFFSGHTNFNEATEAMRLGARDMLTKPIDGRKLVQSVKYARLHYWSRHPAQEAPSTAPAAESRPELPWSPEDVAKVRAGVHRLRAIGEARAKHLPRDLFADPCWDMLLDLYHCTLTSSEATVTSLGAASGVPLTTALRRMDDLQALGLITRARDGHDKRRIVVSLSGVGLKAIELFLVDYVKRQSVPLELSQPS